MENQVVAVLLSQIGKIRIKFPQVIVVTNALRKSVGWLSQEYWILKNGMIATLQYLISDK